jgi:hypothetical protein
MGHRARMISNPLPLLFALVLLCACAAQETAEQSTTSLQEASKRMESVLRNTPQKDLEGFEKLGEQWFLLVRYLGCVEAAQFPAPAQIKSVLIAKWPPVEDFAIKHPLVLRVQVEPTDMSRGYVVALAKQEYSEAPWQITEVWVESNKGAKMRDLRVPSVEIQHHMNRELPRLIREAEQAANDRLQAPGCADGEASK